MRNVQVSIVIPVYNELHNLQKLLPLLEQILKESHVSYQIICIDDHSSDGTFAYVQSLTKNRNIAIYKKIGKKGKAFSLKEGFARAKGSFIVMIDGDLQYPPQVIPMMIEKMKNGADIVVANRMEYKDSKFRKFVSK